MKIKAAIRKDETNKPKKVASEEGYFSPVPAAPGDLPRRTHLYGVGPKAAVVGRGAAVGVRELSSPWVSGIDQVDPFPIGITREGKLALRRLAEAKRVPADDFSLRV